MRAWGVTLLAVALAASTGSAQECPDRDANRRVFFGDLHIHTALSADAYLFGTRNGPNEAYRFARGEAIEIGQPMGKIPAVRGALPRPLDFAAVTDHAESLGAISLCRTPGAPGYDSEGCQLVRTPLPDLSLAEMSTQIGEAFARMASPELCGEDRSRCIAARAEPWRQAREAAAQHNDPCSFTTFIAFEYSPTPEQSKLHRNVIFRGDRVIDAPIAWTEAPTALSFWRRLRAECIDAGTGCDVLAIPHNSNLANGRMFPLDYEGALDTAAQAEFARTRAQLEPLVEIFQRKGDSECRNGLWDVVGAPDELCGFEKFRDWRGAAPEDCRDGQGAGALAGRGCVSRLDYARYALAAGLAEQRRLGFNPHKFGFIGSTDSHDGTAGDTEEWTRDGVLRPPDALEPGRDSSGGLAAVWAEENTRDALFAAMLRRETFATSGPRMSVRFFGGWEFPDKLCANPDLPALGYANGVPMGGDLPPRGDAKAPAFVVSALRDPGTAEHPGGLLQRLQIVKVWPGEGTKLHQAVYDVAGGPNAATVNESTCEASGPGAESLCATWTDPEFDPAVPATYYARVIENPSCRHVAHFCRRLPEVARPARCTDPAVPRQGQERAWTAPVWYTPAP